MIFSDPKTARTINRLRVLNAIQQQGTISRAELSRELLLNKVSISEIVHDLILEGLISEAGKQSGARGRNPVLLQINRKAGFVIALDIGLKNTSTGIGNLSGELVRYQRSPTPCFLDTEDFIDYTAAMIRSQLERIGEPERILGIALSIHAVVDSASGTLLQAADWGLEKIPMASRLLRLFKLPIVIDANVRAMLLAERWFSNIVTGSSLFYINWGQKIGAAQMAGNTILSLNSEFGHTPVASQETCFCGKRGCLEAAAGGWSLQERGNAIVDRIDMSVKQLYGASRENRHLEKLFREASGSMGQAAAIAANIIQPDSIIIGGGLSGIDASYFQIINESFSIHAAPGIRTSLVIRKSELGERTGLLGAVALGLNTFLYRRTQLDSLDTTDTEW